MSAPRQALPAIRPRCCFRYLTFFGINITNSLRCQLPAPKSPRQTIDTLGRCEWGLWKLSPGSTRRAARRPIIFFAADPRRETLALVEPHLHADGAVGRERLGEAVVDVGAQRLQRQLAVQVPLRTGDFRAVQAARHAHLDAPSAETQRRFHRFAHRAAERHALLELHRYRFGDELRIELRLLDLLDVDEDLAVGLLLDLLLELVDFRPLAADDDARARGVDVDLELVRGALDFNLRHAGMLEPGLERVAQLQVLVQQLRVVLAADPARAPRFVEPEAESGRMYFLPHVSSLPAAVFARLPAFFLAPPLARPLSAVLTVFG